MNLIDEPWETVFGLDREIGSAPLAFRGLRNDGHGGGTVHVHVVTVVRHLETGVGFVCVGVKAQGGVMEARLDCERLSLLMGRARGVND